MKKHLVPLFFALFLGACARTPKPVTPPLADHQPWGMIAAKIYDTDGGQKIMEVTPGGPADKAGCRVGDVIRSVAGRHFGDTKSLIRFIRATPPGTVRSFSLYRENELRLDITIGTYPQDEQLYQMAADALRALDIRRAGDLWNKLVKLYPGSYRAAQAKRLLDELEKKQQH